jgi:SAM-dependent methyltransferase
MDTVALFDVIDCDVCAFKHVVPIPTAEELERVFREEYYSQDKPLYLSGTCEELDWWYLVHRDRYDTFEAHLPATRRRVLDIGSGPGLFLTHGKSRGWSGAGIEPSKQAGAHSRDMGLEIVEDFFDGFTAAKLGRFDAVHLSEVLEQAPAPADVLKHAYEIFNPGGLICVVVPNAYTPANIFSAPVMV